MAPAVILSSSPQNPLSPWKDLELGPQHPDRDARLCGIWQGLEAEVVEAESVQHHPEGTFSFPGILLTMGIRGGLHPVDPRGPTPWALPGCPAVLLRHTNGGFMCFRQASSVHPVLGHAPRVRGTARSRQCRCLPPGGHRGCQGSTRVRRRTEQPGQARCVGGGGEHRHGDRVRPQRARRGRQALGHLGWG